VPARGRIVRSAARATTGRGAKRGSVVSARFPTPGTAVLRPRSSARKATATTRSGDIRRPSDAFSPATSKNVVSVAPGQIAVTRTPVRRVSAQSASVNDSTNAFVAPYTDMYGTGWNAAVEATLTIAPRCRASIAGSSACESPTSVVALSWISFSRVSASASCSGAR